MILQVLCQLYQDLVSKGLLPRMGWSSTAISLALCIDKDGNLEQIVPLIKEETIGKKKITEKKEMILPASVERSSNKNANFLWDNPKYLLGISADPEKKEDAIACFEVSAKKHTDLLKEVDSVAAHAIISYFEKWDPKTAMDHPVIQAHSNTLLSSTAGNMVFRIEGKFADEYPELSTAWQNHYNKSFEGEVEQCLVTGKKEVIGKTHPSIRGLRGANTTGAKFISFNEEADCSYEKEQNYNSPVGKTSAFAYVEALNYLLATQSAGWNMGDTSVVCWARGADKQYNEIWDSIGFGKPNEKYSADAIVNMAKQLINGSKVDFDGTMLDPDTTFYILGISPVSARISVQFFLQNSFGNLLKNIMNHYERLDIVRPSNDNYETIPLWILLNETVSQKSKDKSPNKSLVNSVYRSVFADTPYPAALMEQILLRIRTDKEVYRNKAAIIKAYYLKNQNPDCPKEVLTMSLNESSTNMAYNLGRLFALYEFVQKKSRGDKAGAKKSSEANGEKKTKSKTSPTIRNSYFASAMTMPGTVFPVLDRLSKAHLNKLDETSRVFFERQIGQIKENFFETYPARLNLPQQGSFDLGYYHQIQKLYEKKDTSSKMVEESNMAS